MVIYSFYPVVFEGMGKRVKRTGVVLLCRQRRWRCILVKLIIIKYALKQCTHYFQDRFKYNYEIATNRRVNSNTKKLWASRITQFTNVFLCLFCFCMVGQSIFNNGEIVGIYILFNAIFFDFCHACSLSMDSSIDNLLHISPQLITLSISQ